MEKNFSLHYFQAQKELINIGTIIHLFILYLYMDFLIQIITSPTVIQMSHMFPVTVLCTHSRQILSNNRHAHQHPCCTFTVLLSQMAPVHNILQKHNNQSELSDLSTELLIANTSQYCTLPYHYWSLPSLPRGYSMDT